MRKIISNILLESFQCSELSNHIEKWLENSNQVSAKTLFKSNIPDKFRKYTGTLYRGVVGQYEHTNKFQSWTMDKSIAEKFISDPKYRTGPENDSKGQIIEFKPTDDNCDLIDLYSLILFCDPDIDELAKDSALKEHEVIVRLKPSAEINSFI